MKLEINNEEYNYIRKKLKGLEEVYNQSLDQNVRMAVKEQTFVELCALLNNFNEYYGEYFTLCTMSSLKEIVDLNDKIISSLIINKLPKIEINKAKKIFKVKEKQLSIFVSEYNKIVEKENITYYSQQIDQKFIMLTHKDGEFIGVVSDIEKSTKQVKSLCSFCNSFRNGNEITFVTNTIKNKQVEYSTNGQYCCLDYKKCNYDIIDNNKLMEFLSYGNKNKINK